MIGYDFAGFPISFQLLVAPGLLNAGDFGAYWLILVIALDKFGTFWIERHKHLPLALKD
jgi:hypothetical protein